MLKIVAFGAVLALCGCSSNNAAVKSKLIDHGDPAHPLFVGHSDQGEVVVASTHYDAMGGLAVAASDIGLKGKADMVCDREMLTGTHVPKWICRYKKDLDEERGVTQDWLDRPRNCEARCGGPQNTSH
jgi:hypothetical protein